jgi:hypothetical protein
MLRFSPESVRRPHPMRGRKLVQKHLFVALPPAIWELLACQWRIVRCAARTSKKPRARGPSRAEIVAALLELVLVGHQDAIVREMQALHEEAFGRALARHLPDDRVLRRRLRQRRARSS